ncbi:phospho-N-acetylmuramoyl-pentapeptide-transferase [Erysipelothrix larvae]|uniref:Phospho-N-acetylmuramoyl-pentapeptide-transferase n=1 Tax=Erysipelothrix larvae TaxID=1514105 RepID=A0A0X8GZB3_9FIRM|nr:phospho-N-acetylmuramoyl-pentapeptide-transferase [Erysipelothrix larvae]AMC93176.1 phospho-N-acetylmuramoyl-pentapeptide-transferase [Erysipelothrix larvae]
MIPAILGGISALIISVYAYPKYIKYLESRTIQQTVSEFAVDAFKEKKKTVTFGGALFVLIPTILSLIYAIVFKNVWILLMSGTYLLNGILGFVDDYKIVKEGKNDGLSEKQKLIFQVAVALAFYAGYVALGGANVVGIPFVNIQLNIGFVYPILVVFLIVGTANAVNFTDGMDGLAAGTSLIAMLPFMIIAFKHANYDIMFLLFCVFGSVLGFLLYNAHPANIFMGDVGSLPLGALFATTAIVLHQELLLALIGGVFVLEMLSVIIQQTYYKKTGKRLFKYTPIHYSFTLSGWKEVDVVHLFWGIGAVFAILSILIGVFFA